MFVLVRHSDGSKYDGFYVARPGSQHSYTKKLEEANTFPTREAANGQKCGNESVRSVAEIMGQ